MEESLSPGISQVTYVKGIKEKSQITQELGQFGLSHVMSCIALPHSFSIILQPFAWKKGKRNVILHHSGDDSHINTP